MSHAMIVVLPAANVEDINGPMTAVYTQYVQHKEAFTGFPFIQDEEIKVSINSSMSVETFQSISKDLHETGLVRDVHIDINDIHMPNFEEEECHG